MRNSTNKLDRRLFLGSAAAAGLGALTAVGPTMEALGQDQREKNVPSSESKNGRGEKSVFQATEVNHISLDITHSERSVEFYQGLFGMTPVAHGRGSDSFLHFKEGFLNLRPADRAGMNHFCLSIKDFDVNSVYSMLNILELEPWVQGGGNLLHVLDPDGINIQVQEERHGWGRTQSQLTNADKGLFNTVRVHHVALNVTDVSRSKDFYREMFGLRIVGSESNPQRCVLATGESFVELRKSDTPGMHHYAYGVDDFDAPKAIAKLKRLDTKAEQSQEADTVLVRDPQGLLVEITSVDRKLA